MCPSASRSSPAGRRQSSDGTTRIVSTGSVASRRRAKSSARSESTSAQFASSITTHHRALCAVPGEHREHLPAHHDRFLDRQHPLGVGQQRRRPEADGREELIGEGVGDGGLALVAAAPHHPQVPVAAEELADEGRLPDPRVPRISTTRAPWVRTCASRASRTASSGSRPTNSASCTVLGCAGLRGDDGEPWAEPAAEGLVVPVAV